MSSVSSKKPTVIAIIPARGGSKGIPLKNIKTIGGQPLIAWSIAHAKCSDYISKVYVSTDNNEIANIADEFGADIIERPSELAGDTASTESCIIHALDTIEKENEIAPEIVVLLQATSPLRDNNDINAAINIFLQNDLDSLFSCSALQDHFIWEEKDGNFESINYDYHNRKLRQNIKTRYLENGSIYVFKSSMIRKTHNRLGGKIGIYEMESWKSAQIDELSDIAICEYYLENVLNEHRNE